MRWAKRRPHAVDDLIAELGGDDLAPQAVSTDRLGEALGDPGREVREQVPFERRVVDPRRGQELTLQLELRIRGEHGELRPGEPAERAAAKPQRLPVR